MVLLKCLFNALSSSLFMALCTTFSSSSIEIEIGRALLSIEGDGDNKLGEDVVVAGRGDLLVVPDLVVGGVLRDLELFFLLTVMLSIS